MSYTYSVMHISPEAYAEIRMLTVEAGFEHAIHRDTGESPEVVDMRGIAVAPTTVVAREPVGVLLTSGPAKCEGQMHAFLDGSDVCECRTKVRVVVETAAVPGCMDLSHQHEVTRIAKALGLPSSRRRKDTDSSASN